MNYYIAKTDTLEKVIDLKVNTMTTMDYIKLTNKYFQLITGEYILLSEADIPNLQPEIRLTGDYLMMTKANTETKQ